mmetsp:Transcript_2656/g.7896  ORF Transcript_2656/g.7896 Transcript_2656/m.7896 type:complete len:451 (+) Transcript_2656:572-1924(+)
MHPLFSPCVDAHHKGEHGGGGAHSAEDQAEAQRWAIAGMVFILLGGAVGVILPMAAQQSAGGGPSRVMGLGRAFAAGVVLATGLVHMLPGAMHALEDPCLGLGPFPWASVIATAAALLTNAIEFVAGLHLTSGHGAAGADAFAGSEDGRQPLLQDDSWNGAGGADRAAVPRRGRHRRRRSASKPPSLSTVYSGQVTDEVVAFMPSSDEDPYDDVSSDGVGYASIPEHDPEQGATDQGGGVGGRNSNGGSRGGGNGGNVAVTRDGRGGTDGVLSGWDSSGGGAGSGGSWSRARRIAAAQVLELGIAMHSVLIGMALGVSDSVATVRPLATALVFHQTFEGFALGGALADAGHDGWHFVSRGLAFAFTTPAGVAVGLMVRRGYSPHSPAALAVHGAFNGASAGILLYLGLVNLVAVDFFSPRMRSAGPLVQTVSYVALFCGAGAMSLLAVWA